MFARFKSLIYEHSGISLSDGKVDLVRTRLGKRIRARGVGGFQEYYDLVTNDRSGAELVNLIDSISTNLTYFFREPEHFRYLSHELAPELMKLKQKHGERRIRFWSAGCSTGEEAYSLVMAAHAFLAPLSAWDFKLLASDISTKVLSRAKAGCYPSSQLKGLSPAQIGDFFHRDGQNATVGREISSLITFARVNLMEPFPFKGKFDVIFCRNVMIYFDKATQERLTEKFYNALSPGGRLFIGHSENLTGIKHSFNYVRPAVYVK